MIVVVAEVVVLVAGASKKWLIFIMKGQYLYISHIPVGKGGRSSSIMQAGCPVTQSVQRASEKSWQLENMRQRLSALLYVYHIAMSPYAIASA